MQILRTASLPALLITWLATAGPAQATVKDEAKLFSPAAVERANEKIRALREKYKKDLVIETFKEIPEDRKKGYSAEKKAEFFGKWAHDRAESLGVNGVYVLICKDPGHFQVLVGNTTLAKAFPPSQRAALEAVLKQDLRNKPDTALDEAVSLVASSYAGNAPPGRPNPSKPGAGGKGSGNNDNDGGGGLGVGGWICIGLCVLMGVWLVVGLMRGMGSGGGGMGGGGGGGFFTSLLGGMFGAVAGMWLYNNVFGGGGHSAYGGDGGMAGGGGDGTTGDSPGYSGTDTDYSGGGGDWGGDAGGGGGDWGGGGGDFGGGGGDW